MATGTGTGTRGHILINGAPMVSLSNLENEYGGGSEWMEGIHGTIGLSPREPKLTITATYKLLTSDDSSFAIACIDGSLVDVQLWWGTKTAIGQLTFSAVKESQAAQADAEGTCTLSGPAFKPR